METSSSLFIEKVLEQMRLEKRKDVMKILNSQPEIKGAEGMLLRKMAKIMYEKDVNISFELWNELVPQSPSQQTAIGISFIRFSEIHSVVQEYFQNKGSESVLAQTILKYLTNKSPNGPGYIWNDNNEISQNDTRSLETLRTQGVAIGIPESQIATLKEFSQQQPNCPLIDSMKNTRIARINGFSRSLMTLTIHDLYDHFFTYDVLDNAGILERYADFFDKVGNPQLTDLYAREGELVASVAYNTRAWSLKEEGIKPDITAAQLIRLILKSNDLTANQKSAVKILKEEILPDKEKSLRMGYIVTRVLIQLMEQRRKQGFILDLDKEHKPTGILSIVDPEYMSLIVEIANLLDQPEFKTFDFLVNISIFVEEYLSFLASGNDGENNSGENLNGKLFHNDSTNTAELVLRIQDIHDKKVRENTTLPLEKIKWILENPGNSATQEDLC